MDNKFSPNQDVHEVVDALDEVLKAYAKTHNVRYAFEILGRGVTVRLQVHAGDSDD